MGRKSTICSLELEQITDAQSFDYISRKRDFFPRPYLWIVIVREHFTRKMHKYAHNINERKKN